MARQRPTPVSVPFAPLQVVMMLFEREGAPEGAVIFARAALQHLPAAYAQAPATPQPPPQQQLQLQAGGTGNRGGPAGPSTPAAGGTVEISTPHECEDMAVDGTGRGEGASSCTPAAAAARAGGAGVDVGGHQLQRRHQLRLREARLWSNIFKVRARWEVLFGAERAVGKPV